MSRKKKRWLIAISVSLLVIVVALSVAAFLLGRRFQPFIRQQAIDYLSERFNSDVELRSLRVHMPRTSPLRLLLTRGRGAIARVEGQGISMRLKGRKDAPPIFAMKKFRFDVDLGKLFDTPRIVRQVTLDGMQINVPPKGQRPESKRTAEESSGAENSAKPSVIIEDVIIRDAQLVLLPKDPKKIPLRFDIHQLHLQSAGIGTAMQYQARLTNAKPPGEIDSTGRFGPWVAREPGDSPLDGTFRFEKADLGVFSSIAGILNATGRFAGTLDSIDASGQAKVPDFRLKMAGNPVPLSTRFEVRVDGTNGNTILKPVIARLGSTDFTTSGGVIKHEGDQRRAISLDVLMPRGELRDLLRLAMKGTPFMEGRVFLKTRIDIPPLTGKVREKLRLDGRFTVSEGKFLRSTIQDQIDRLSRRGQGEPGNQEIDEVVSRMQGRFKLENQVITFRSLSFGVPGADINLAGSYDMDRDIVDFHGALKLQARVSQTMTGWKRWALKPADPFFAKHGAGTFLRIKVEGDSGSPKFGLDRGHKR